MGWRYGAVPASTNRATDGRHHKLPALVAFDPAQVAATYERWLARQPLAAVG